MTRLTELSEINQKRHKGDYINIVALAVFILGPSIGGYFGGDLNLFGDPYDGIILLVLWASPMIGISLWLGYFRTLRCPDCSSKLKYRKSYMHPSESSFYCEHCGTLDLPPPIYGKVIGICIVCNLPISEYDARLSCPVCFSLAHENHFLEWIKIKGYCPQCNTHLNLARVRASLNVENNLMVGSVV